MTTEALFWDRIADKYSRQKIGNPTAYEQTLEAVRAYLSPQDHVLEHGCGTGSTALILADDVARITAADFAPRMVEIAEGKRRDAKVENVEFLNAGIDDPRLMWVEHDAVLGFNLLHLVPDLDAALAAMFSQVKPGGYVITKSGCVKDMNPLLRWAIKAMQLIGRAPFVQYFTAEELEKAMRWAGFEIVSSREFDRAKHIRFIVARRPPAR